MINFYNCDNIEFMKTKTDNFYDLAIVDPPYGLGNKLAHAGNGKNAQSKFTADFKSKNWDNEVPPHQYWAHLFRVSKNQIIWGGNYFLNYLPATRCFITWDKMVYIPSMSRIEMAWTSFDRLPKLVQINNNDSNRIHLTQKPVKLYRWLLSEFAEQGFKILDTHGGSFTHAIAAEIEGYDLDIMDKDLEYYNNGIEQYNEFNKQKRLF